MEKNLPKPDLAGELAQLRARLNEAEEALNAIRNGEVDGLVMAGPEGRQVFTLQGAQEPYRLLIEQMSEGALTLSREGFILYANQTFARLLQMPLGRVIGAELRAFVSPAEQPEIAALIEAAWGGSSRGEVSVRAADDSSVPLRLGLSRLKLDLETLVCVVATDLTEVRKRQDELACLHTDLERRVEERTTDLAASRLAALSMMEEAVETRQATEAANRNLQREIAERGQAEEHVARLHQQNQLILSSAAEGILGLGLHGEHTFVNAAAAKMLGYEAAELVGRASHSTWHHTKPDGSPYPVAECQIHATCWDGVARHGSNEVFWRKDGTSFPVEYASMPIYEQGRLAGTVVTFADITERRRAEQALRDSQELYCSLVENLPQSVFRKDRDGRFLFCNRRFCEDVGRSSEEIIGKTDADLFPPHVAETYRQDDRRVMESGLVLDQEEEHLSVGGRKLFVQVVKTPLRDATGGVTGIQGIFWDITERILAEESHARLATAVEQATEAVMITDVNATILYVNPAFEKITGYTREEALGQNPRMLKSGKQDAESYRQMWAVLTAGKVWKGHFINKRKDGTLYEEDVSISPVRDAAGQIINYVGVKRDVTEEKLLAARFLRAQRLESIGTLAGGIAHDLNNVLAPILMSVEILRLKFNLPEAERTLAIIESSAQRGAEMVKQVLTFARGSQGEKVALSISRLIKEIGKMIEETLPKSIQVRVELAKNLGMVTGDPTHLHQVLMNLCVNARDAMPGGGTLTLGAANSLIDESFARMHPGATPGPYVKFIVRDTGTGIPAHVQDRIFEPFFTTKTLDKGTGLGLSTVLGIVKSHGGFVSVWSEEGRGSEFCVYLPAQGTAATQSAPAARGDLPQGNGETILVVDDEDSISSMARQTLEIFGYHVLTARNGKEAVALCAQRPGEIHLMLTDMMMPVMDGAAAILAVHQMDPQIKIIASTGLGSDVPGTDSAKLPVEAFLRKPYISELLLKTVHDVLHPS